MFFVGILFGFLPVRIHALGYDPFRTGILLTIVALSYVVIQPVAGVIADKTSVALTVRFGVALSALAIILIPFVRGYLLLGLSVLAGFGVGVVRTNTDTLISRLAPSGRLGATMGAAGSFKEFGDMVGPILIGLLSQTLGLKMGFLICGLFGLLALILVTMKFHSPNQITT